MSIVEMRGEIISSQLIQRDSQSTLLIGVMAPCPCPFPAEAIHVTLAVRLCFWLNMLVVTVNVLGGLPGLYASFGAFEVG